MRNYSSYGAWRWPVPATSLQLVALILGVGLFFLQQSIFVSHTTGEYCPPTAAFVRQQCFTADITKKGFPLAVISEVNPKDSQFNSSAKSIRFNRNREIVNFIFWIMIPVVLFKLVQMIDS